MGKRDYVEKYVLEMLMHLKQKNLTKIYFLSNGAGQVFFSMFYQILGLAPPLLLRPPILLEFDSVLFNDI